MRRSRPGQVLGTETSRKRQQQAYSLEAGVVGWVSQNRAEASVAGMKRMARRRMVGDQV